MPARPLVTKFVRASCLILFGANIAACDAGKPIAPVVEAQPEPQEKTDEQPIIPSVEEMGFEPWKFGSETPRPERDGGYTSEQESRLAQRTALSKVCRKIEERMVQGRIPRSGRRCQVIFVGGYIPTELIWSRGSLESDSGSVFEVVWVWNTLPVGKLEGCASDPVDEQERIWRLTLEAHRIASGKRFLSRRTQRAHQSKKIGSGRIAKKRGWQNDRRQQLLIRSSWQPPPAGR